MDSITMMRTLALLCLALCASRALGAHASGGSGCLAGVRGLFCGKSAYEVLANKLHEATASDQLEENVKAAAGLTASLDEANEKLRELVDTFKALKGSSADTEVFCSGANMANLRRVASAVHLYGNLGPKRVSQPVRRLNMLVMQLAADARFTCFTHLETRWDQEARAVHKTRPKEVRRFAARLAGLPDTFLYPEHHRHQSSSDASFARYYFGHLLGGAVSQDEKWEHEPTVEGVQRQTLFNGQDKELLAKQLDRFVYKPCAQFVELEEVKEVLRPYSDLLAATTFVGPGYLDEFWNKDVRPQSRFSIFRNDREVLDKSFSLEACTRLLTVPATKAVESIVKARKFDDKPSYVPSGGGRGGSGGGGKSLMPFMLFAAAGGK